MPNSWCCPESYNNWKVLACKGALGKPLGEEACFDMGCYPDHIGRLLKERAHPQKPSDCTECQRFIGGHCLNCYEAKMFCLHGNCVTAEQYKKHSEKEVENFIEKKEAELRKHELSEKQKAQEEFNKAHPPASTSKEPDTYLPPPVLHQTEEDIHERIRRNNERAKICEDRKNQFIIGHRGRFWTKDIWEKWGHVCDGL